MRFTVAYHPDFLVAVGQEFPDGRRATFLDGPTRVARISFSYDWGNLPYEGSYIHRSTLVEPMPGFPAYYFYGVLSPRPTGQVVEIVAFDPFPDYWEWVREGLDD